MSIYLLATKMPQAPMGGGKHAAYTHIRGMNGMEPFKCLLQCRAELVEQCYLAGKDRIPATWWSLHHPE